MGDENSLAGTTKAHKHSALSSDGGFLETAVTGVTNLSLGSIVYGNASEIVTELSAGSDGDTLQLSSGLPSWASGANGATCVVPNVSAGNGLRKDVPRFGVQVLTNDLSIGKTLTDVSFYLQAGGASGNGECRVYNGSGTLQATSTNTKDWATLPSSPTYEKVTFDISHTVSADDRIVIAGGTTGLGAEVTVNHSPGSQEAISPNLPTLYDVDFQACVEYNSASSTWVYQGSLNSCVKWCYNTS